jgi:acetylornithine deacetylase
LLDTSSEESPAIPGVGVDKLVKTGKLEGLKNGPIFWVDSADSNPRIGMDGEGGRWIERKFE